MIARLINESDFWVYLVLTGSLGHVKIFLFGSLIDCFFDMWSIHL